MRVYEKPRLSRFRILTILVFLLVASLVVGLAFWVLGIEKAQVLSSLELELAEVSHFKADQILEWRKDSVEKGLLVARDPLFLEGLRGLPTSGQQRDLIQERLDSVAATLHLWSAFVCDFQGGVRIYSQVGELRPPLPPSAELLAIIATKNQAYLGDLVQDKSPRFYLDLLLPLGKGGEGLCLVLRLDPRASLYPVVMGWPRPSSSAEALLVRREGDSVVYLSPLRHVDTPPLETTAPIGLVELPAAHLLLGGKGFFIGRDYRGSPVVAYLSHLAESPWGLVVKMDRGEGMRPLGDRTIFVASLSGVVILLLLALLLFVTSRSESLAWWRRYADAAHEAEVNQEFAATLASMADGVVSSDARDRVRWLNPSATALLGWSLDEARGRSKDEVLVREAAEGKESLRRRDGSWLPTTSTASPLLDSEGKPAGTVLVFRDASAEARALEAIRERESLYSHLFTDSVAACLLVDPADGHIVDANRSASAFYGQDIEALRRLRVAELNACDESVVAQRLARIFHGDMTSFETRHHGAGGELRDVEVHSGPICIEGRTLLFSTIIDVSGRVAAEGAQAALLRERELLLRELHHRTKNNLQIISALLGLQASSFSDPLILECFQDMQGRIQTMALAHEKLYRASDVSQVDLGSYLAELASLLSGPGLRVQTLVEPCPVGIDTASPCGLVVNELITNTRKHGHPGGGSCTAKLSLGPGPLGGIRLDYKDDGVGLREGFDPRRAPTLGLSLIISIVENQLLGRITFNPGPGFSCLIEFDPGVSRA